MLTSGGILNFLKLRGGWAKIGNATDPYVSNSYYSVVSAPFNGTTLYYNPTTYPARDLRPEMIKTWEVGLEASLLDNRIHFDGAYYQKVTTDQIMQANVATSTGYSSMYINAGKVSNKGVELQLSADIFRNPKGFSWTTTFNWARIKAVSTNFILILLPDRNWTLMKSEAAGAVPAMQYLVKAGEHL